MLLGTEKNSVARSEVSTAVLIQIKVFGVGTLRRLVNTFWSSEAWLDPEDGDKALFRNVCNYLPMETG